MNVKPPPAAYLLNPELYLAAEFNKKKALKNGATIMAAAKLSLNRLKTLTSRAIIVMIANTTIWSYNNLCLSFRLCLYQRI